MSTDGMTPARRPVGNVPTWATNVNMTDGVQPWNGTPTKVRPSAGIIAEGFHPTEQPPAERFNWKLNDIDRRLMLVDLLEARTWVEPSDGTGLDTPGVGNAVGDFAWASWTGGVPALYHATNSTIVRKSLDGGYTWSSDLTVAGAAFSAIATRDDGAMSGATCAAYTNAGVAKVALTGAALPGAFNGWASTSLTGSGSNMLANCVAADPTLGNVFFVGGNDFTGGNYVPKIWRVVDTHGAFSSQIVVSVAGAFGAIATNTVRIIAVSPTYKLAACWQSGTTNLLWRWLDGDGTAATVTPPTTDEIRDILWLPEDGVFLLIAQSAGGNVTLWTSADGSSGSWSSLTLTGAGTTLFGNANVFLQGAAVRGSIIVIPMLAVGTGNFIMLSGDLGATWECLPDPLARHQTQTPKPVSQKVRSIGPRFMSAGYVSASTVAHAYTMRAG